MDRNRLEAALWCPLTGGVAPEPVVAQDGQVYDEKQIDAWLAAHGTSPVTGLPIDRVYVRPECLTAIRKSYDLPRQQQNAWLPSGAIDMRRGVRTMVYNNLNDAIIAGDQEGVDRLLRHGSDASHTHIVTALENRHRAIAKRLYTAINVPDRPANLWWVLDTAIQDWWGCEAVKWVQEVDPDVFRRMERRDAKALLEAALDSGGQVDAVKQMIDNGMAPTKRALRELRDASRIP